MLYKEKPSVVKVEFGYDHSGESGATESVYLVGVTPDQVLAALEAMKGEASPKAKKPRKARRSRNEMTRAEAETSEESAGEAAMRRLKEAAPAEDVPPPHDKPKKDLWP